jgi:crotonobetainyl-CoA:carnitine CoA-transferase CaiB-like acyl-CoA transferase
MTGAKPTGPLAGVRVIDLTTVVLGPFATQTLGDMGADVIKIETPGGDAVRFIGPCRTPGMASYYTALNRNKRAVTLDLKHPPARAALSRLIEGADVVVHNMRLGAAERLGLDYESLRAINPRIVLACASGFRKNSTAREKPAYDDLIQGRAGLAALNPGPDGAPRYFPTVVADKHCGLMLAAMIGMALFHRERTGEGQEVHVPMLETMLSFILVEHLWGASIGEPERGMGYPRMLTPHRRPYPTKDGYICAIAVSDAHYRKIFTAFGMPELMDDPRFNSIKARSDNVELVYGLLAENMPRKTTAEWTAILDEADVPNGPVNALPQLLEDAYLRETGFFQSVDHPVEGRMVLTAIPAQFSATQPNLHRLPPTFGEHTAEVLREAGYSSAEIADITRSGT